MLEAVAHERRCDLVVAAGLVNEDERGREAPRHGERTGMEDHATRPRRAFVGMAAMAVGAVALIVGAFPGAASATGGPGHGEPPDSECPEPGDNHRGWAGTGGEEECCPPVDDDRHGGLFGWAGTGGDDECCPPVEVDGANILGYAGGGGGGGHDDRPDDCEHPPPTHPTIPPPTHPTIPPHPTTSTTEATTTTTEAPTTSVAPTTPTTTPSTTISSGGSLPVTGSNTGLLVAIGGGLLVAGAVLVATTRQYWRRFI